jgi:uncharacterized protein
MARQTRYVDVNVFIYWLGSHPKFSETAKKWISEIEESSGNQYFTSAVTLYEALVVIGELTGKSFKDKTLVNGVINSIINIRGLTIEPLEPEDFSKASELMNDCKLDFEDCLHLAVALRLGAIEIVSNDKHFNSALIKRVI